MLMFFLVTHCSKTGNNEDEERESCRPRRHPYRVDKEWRSEVIGDDYHIA
jgi:hypothetical protein